MEYRGFFMVFLLMVALSSHANGEKTPIDSAKAEQRISVMDNIDSLYFSTMENPTIITNFTPYNFDYDSIPAYSDTTYYERLEALNILSTFDLKFNEEVRKYIIYFSSRRAGLISRALQNKETYFPIFEEMLDKYNLPQELKYLAIVESALNPNAKSRAGAVGLWQFMPSTGRMYGLKYNSRIDQRRDVYASTEAACRHFVDLYNIYHDWNLVLAAYNAGPGNVNKAIRRADSLTDYWEIRAFLPKETRGYVPAFIAVNYLVNYYSDHNIKAPENQNIIKTPVDTVYVNNKIYLKNVSLELGLSLVKIKKLNPQYTKGYIPATSTKKYKITLPVENIAEFIKYRQALISSLDPNTNSTSHALE